MDAGSASVRWPHVQTGGFHGSPSKPDPDQPRKAAETQQCSLQNGKALQSEESKFQKPSKILIASTGFRHLFSSEAWNTLLPGPGHPPGAPSSGRSSPGPTRTQGLQGGHCYSVSRC